MFTVTTPTDSTEVLTLAEIKQALGLDQDEDDEALYSRLSRLGGLMAEECLVPGDGVHPPTLLTEGITETFRLNEAARCLVLARRPVSSIVSVSVAGIVLEAASFEVDAARAMLFRLEDDERVRWSAGKIVVVYEAGWPRERLKAAAIATFREQFWSEGRNPLVRSETVDQVGRVDYWVGGLDTANGSVLSNQARAVLDPFRYSS